MRAFSEAWRLPIDPIASAEGAAMRPQLPLSIAVGLLCLCSPALAQEQRGFVQGFGGLRVDNTFSTETALGGLVGGALTPNIQVIGEAGRISDVLPVTTGTLLAFSPIGVRTSAWYAEGGVRFTRAPAVVRPYVETSAGFTRLRTGLIEVGSGTLDRLADVALRSLDRTYPIATVGAGTTFEGGAFVFDVGYRYRRIFSDEWVAVLALGQPLDVNEVRVGLGVRF
jgi:hypothetical protein